MIEELLLRFSRENFDDANYVPLLHGHSETAKPLSLIIKQKRSIWKHRYSFAKDEITFLAGLENFVSRHCEKKYLDAVELKVIEEQVMEKGENDPVDRYKRMNEILTWKCKVRKLILQSTVFYHLMMISDGFSGKLEKYARRKESSYPQFRNCTTHGAIVLAI